MGGAVDQQGMKTDWQKLLSRSLCVVFLLATYGCSSRMDIDRLVAEPGRYNERKVVVAGKVTQTYAVPVIGQSLLRIDDGTGQLWIKPRNRVAFEGDEIEVYGTLKIGVRIANRSFGVIVIEDQPRK